MIKSLLRRRASDVWQRAIECTAIPQCAYSNLGLRYSPIATSVRSNSEADNAKTGSKVVVLGSGWGAARFAKDLDLTRYSLTVWFK